VECPAAVAAGVGVAAAIDGCVASCGVWNRLPLNQK
jgi:hypothetical protein